MQLLLWMGWRLLPAKLLDRLLGVRLWRPRLRRRALLLDGGSKSPRHAPSLIAATAAAAGARGRTLLPLRMRVRAGVLPWLLWVGWRVLPSWDRQRARRIAVGVWPRYYRVWSHALLCNGCAALAIEPAASAAGASAAAVAAAAPIASAGIASARDTSTAHAAVPA